MSIDKGWAANMAHDFLKINLEKMDQWVTAEECIDFLKKMYEYFIEIQKEIS